MLPPTRLAALALLGLTACASSPEPNPRYRPAESVLEVIAVLRRHVPDDTYRFEPAHDFTGRNVYRSTLLRLESMEHIHGESLRASQMDGVVAFAKGRALERVRAYDLAADTYLLSAALDAELATEAQQSADVCTALEEATSLAVGLDDLADPSAVSSDANSELARYAVRSQRLEELLRVTEGTHYEYVTREEIERTDLARAEYFVAMRQILPQGDVRAAAELEHLVTHHPTSKYANRHVLKLAQLYEAIAVEYVGAHPPESLSFDPVRFQEFIDSTSRLYEVVASQDGKPEKLEASRRLEAFLAFALRVDRDRFTR